MQHANPFPALAGFAAFYLLFLLLPVRLFGGDPVSNHLIGLVAVILTSLLTIRLTGDRTRLGLLVGTRTAGIDLLVGGLLALFLIAAADTLVSLSAETNRTVGRGFPWLEVALFYVPAALHEELLFRGYIFQKLAAWRTDVALVIMPLLFAALHAGNSGAGLLPFVNVWLAGIVLSLAWLWRRSLWLPIAIHLGWNVTIGPLLGHRVSGFTPQSSIVATEVYGPRFITGGAFGIEGSIWMTVVETAAIVFLLYEITCVTTPPFRLFKTSGAPEAAVARPGAQQEEKKREKA
ncbi:MAG TPA: CPBP family intramembrane glutamic endopeptidase [Thermoanaerobaculia bacterium]|nr:CPBP family intramembrane glutamic endopeptidase [Thermoanaerobaculia bacterium]